MSFPAYAQQTSFNQYDALKEYIEGLPEPKTGYVRVFRGQCKDYGSIRPTGVRTPLRNEKVWLRYCQMLATDILFQQGVEIVEAFSRGKMYGYWYYAIVQHYGPGTHLLDVTHSIDIAIWFALHRASVNKQLKIAFQDTRPGSLLPTLYREDDWTSYREWQEPPGVLYIFDVPPWGAVENPRHGELVDLARGPEVFGKSARIQAQRACLIASDPQVNGGDLREFLTHPPIQVGWPMTGSDAVNTDFAKVFPDPIVDEWYTRLLFLPIVHQVWHEAPHWRLAHPVQLSMYIQHLDPAMYAIQFKALQPPLLWPWLVSPALQDKPGDMAAVERAEKFLRSVPILLEAPIVAMQPDPDDESWDHALLTTDLPGVLGVLDWQGGEELSRTPVLLNDVLFELSPLENVGWTDLLREGGEMQVPRAIHLVRDGDFEWRLQILFQLAPKERIMAFFNEAASIRFEQSVQRFQIQSGDGWEDICTNPIAAKSLLVSLLLLRSLSPVSNPHLTIAENYRTATAALIRTAELAYGLHYYLLRDMKTHEPYMPR